MGSWKKTLQQLLSGGHGVRTSIQSPTEKKREGFAPGIDFSRSQRLGLKRTACRPRTCFRPLIDAAGNFAASDLSSGALALPCPAAARLPVRPPARPHPRMMLSYADFFSSRQRNCAHVRIRSRPADRDRPIVQGSERRICIPRNWSRPTASRPQWAGWLAGIVFAYHYSTYTHKMRRSAGGRERECFTRAAWHKL